jgi:cathepsin B
MRCITLLIAVLGYANARVVLDNVNLADRINAMKTTWTAVNNDANKQNYKMGVAADYDQKFRQETVIRQFPITAAPPTSFDARVQWPGCAGDISDIRDQGQCGSCWAVAAAECYTDRACIATGAKVTMPYSSWDIATCCKACAPGEGCQGGYPNRAWDWLLSTGVVTGGPITNRTGCKPYPTGFGDEACHESCQSGYTVAYADDKRKANSSWGLPNNVEQIQAAVMKGGPVEATFVVYDDFFSYHSGVYTHKTGGMAGRHAVRVLGWGVDGSTPYWLVANSWGTNWGWDHGYFKIMRGTDECQFESGMVGGDVV